MSTLRFAVSRSEINRRALAFLALAITWPVALACMSLLPFCGQSGVTQVLATTIAVAMAAIGITTIYFLYTRHLHTVFEVDGANLNRVSLDRRYTYDLMAVEKIMIKRTSYGTIRQISLTGPDWHTNIDGIEAKDFENLYQLLADRCPNAKTLKSREPLNFDHTLFYPILGLLMATISYAMACTVVDSNVLNGMIIIAAGYGLGVAVYTASARPLARQYGAKSQAFDYLVATIIAILAAIVVIVRLSR